MQEYKSWNPLESEISLTAQEQPSELKEYSFEEMSSWIYFTLVLNTQSGPLKQDSPWSLARIHQYLRIFFSLRELY